MDYRIDFAGEDAYVVVTTSGRAEPAGFKRLLTELVGDERFRSGASLLNDHSALDFRGLTPSDIRDISSFVSRLDEQHGFGPLAVVVPNRLAFGFARMAQTLLKTDLRSRIFYSREDAVEWLREEGTRSGPEHDG